MAGEMPIPKLPLVGSVMDFGAVGDGVADDTRVGIHTGQVLLHRLHPFITAAATALAVTSLCMALPPTCLTAERHAMSSCSWCDVSPADAVRAEV